MPVLDGGTYQGDGSANDSNAQAFSVTGNGGAIDSAGHAMTLGGVFSDNGGTSGMLIIANSTGSGSVTFTAANTITGPVAIASGGTLNLTGNGSFYSASSIQDNGAFDISGTTNGTSITSLGGNGTVRLGSRTLTITNGSDTFSGAINGSGGLAVSGGTETLSGTNTYAGTTTISGGTLQIGNGGTSGTLGTGNVIDNATLAFDRSDAITVANAISGTGALNQKGSGTVILTGANTYAGTTTISGGTLQIGNGGTSGTLGTGNVIDNATLAFNRSDAITVANAISGTGALNQNGSGAVILTGANTYNGATTINGGTLVVDGSIASTATANSGGALSGTGTVGSVKVMGGGTLAPGSGTPGTALMISGNLAFQSGAIYLVQLNPSTASSTISGSATLTGGNVQTVFAPGSYVTKQYTILHASGGLGGTKFSGVNGNVPAGFTESLNYTSTDVLLNLTATLGAGLNPNQQKVAGALNSFFNSGSALPANFVTVFGLTGSNLGTALTQLSGETATGARQGAFQFTNQFLGLMVDPFVDGRSGTSGVGGSAFGFAPEREALPEDIALAYAKAMNAPATKAPPTVDQRWSVWASGFGGYNKTNGDAATGSNDLTARAGGGAAGLDYHFSRDVMVGFALAGGGTSWGLAQGLGGGKSDVFEGGVYAAARSGPAYVAASFAAANHWMSTDRSALGDQLTASFNAQSFGGRIESGYRFATPVVAVTPYAALQLQSFRTPTYSEADLTGGGFGLTYNGRTATDTRSELGARFDRALLVAPDAVLTLRGRFAWAHDWVSDPSLAAVFQALPGTSFIVNGATPAKDIALASAGADLHLARGVILSAKFDGEFAGKTQTYAGTGSVRFTW